MPSLADTKHNTTFFVDDQGLPHSLLREEQNLYYVCLSLGMSMNDAFVRYYLRSPVGMRCGLIVWFK